MSFDTHSTLASTSIVSVVSQAGNSLVVNVQTGTGSLFAANQQVLISPPNVEASIGNTMICRLTGINTDQLTLDTSTSVREGSGLRLAQIGDSIANGLTPKALTDIEAATGGGGGGGGQGDDVEAATELTLTPGKSLFVIHASGGPVEIDLIDTTGWTAGDMVTLFGKESFSMQFNQTADGAFAPIGVNNGSTNFNSLGKSVTLVLMGPNSYYGLDMRWLIVSIF